MDVFASLAQGLAVAVQPMNLLFALTGVLLGTADDEVYAALYWNGRVVRMYDEFTRPPGATPQTELRLEITNETAVPPGTYHLILRVNGQQAKDSPAVQMVAP